MTNLRTLVATGALLGATLVGGLAAPTSAADPDSPRLTCAELWELFPEQLKDDIRAARALPAEEQARAMWVIRRAALRGVYGERIEELAEERREARIEAWKSFPDQLKDDIKAVLALPFEEQRRAMREIRRDALDGVYGEEVQAMAEARAAWLAGCRKIGESV